MNVILLDVVHFVVLVLILLPAVWVHSIFLEDEQIHFFGELVVFAQMAHHSTAIFLNGL